MALVPDAVSKLSKRVRRRRRARRRRGRLLPRRGLRRGGWHSFTSVWDAEGVVKVRKPTTRKPSGCDEGQLLIGFLEPLTDPAGIERLARRGVQAFAMESIPRITARAADGRAVLAGDRLRLQGGADRGRSPAALLPDADDRGGDGRAREGARPRRRGRRTAGDRDRAPTRRGRRRRSTCVPSSRSRSRASAQPSSTSGHRGGDGGRVCPRADGGRAASPAGGARRAHPGLRRRDHDGAHPRPTGAEADSRSSGGPDAPGLGDRRPGGRGRRQLRGRRSRARSSSGTASLSSA